MDKIKKQTVLGQLPPMPFGYLQYFAGEGGGEGGSEGGDPPKTYTEEELKVKIKDERKAAAAEAIKKRFGDLADVDLEEMKAAIELKKKVDEEKNKSKGTPPAKDELVNVDEIVEEKLKAQMEEANKKTFQRLLNAEVKVLATELGFADWEDALALSNLIDVKEDDKGNLTGVKEALEELAKKKPHLLKSKGNGSFGSDIPNNNQQRQKSKEDIVKLAQTRGATTQQANDPWTK